MSGQFSDRRTQRISALALGIVSLLGVGGTCAAAEQYVLAIPGTNDPPSAARFVEGRLVITDAQGDRTLYVRDRRLDSQGGEYLGYYSREARQALRWPARGTGSMFIGDPEGRQWRKSLQQVSPLDARDRPRPRRIETRRPVNPPRVNPPPGQLQPGVDAPNHAAGPANFAWQPSENRQLDVGYIDGEGRLQFYRGSKDRWRRQDVGYNRRLTPRAPLAFARHPGGELPAIYTVDPSGSLIEIVGGRQARPVIEDVSFQRGTHLAVHADDAELHGFAIDKQGRPWQVGLQNSRHRLIDEQVGRFPAGAPVASLPLRAGRTAAMFAIDRRGSLMNYRWADARWSAPSPVAGGFAPGAPVAAKVVTLDGREVLFVAAVDMRGRLQLLFEQSGRWTALPPQRSVEATLPPGTPVALNSTAGGISVSAVDQQGIWQYWDREPSGAWQATEIARGFPIGAPVAFDPQAMTGFGIDATGRLIASAYWEDDWHSYLCTPNVDLAPRLIERRIESAPRLSPARVQFVNSGDVELTVHLFDAFVDRAPRKLDIPPRGAVPVELQREPGATLREVFATPTPNGWVEEVAEYHIPPQPRYMAVVWTKQVTYSYVDPKNISVLQDFDLKTHQSLGVLNLPPGVAMRDGEQIDIFREAVYQRNPGAAAWFSPPAQGPEFVPRPDRSSLPGGRR